MTKLVSGTITLTLAALVVTVAFFPLGQNASRGAVQPGAAAAPSAEARAAAAKRTYELIARNVDGQLPMHQGIEHPYLWSKRWMEAQRDVDMARDGGLAAAEAHLEHMQALAARVAEAHKAGAVSAFEIASTEYYVAEAEELVARAKAR